MGTDKLRRVTATEFRENRLHFMKQAEICPIVITKRGKDHTVLMNYSFYKDLNKTL